MNTGRPTNKGATTGKAQIQQESPHKQKGNPRASRQGDHRDCTTESFRTPTVAPQNPTELQHYEDKLAKQSIGNHRNKHEVSPKMGRQREPTIKRNGRLPRKRVQGREGKQLLDIEFKKMIIKMLKKLSDNYKEMRGNTAI